MPRTEEANESLRESQRAKILESARAVFSRKGWSATMADVAAEAGISQGLAYRYFASKEAIFNELAGHAVQSSMTALQRILQKPGTPGERLSFLISKIVENKQGLLDFFQLFTKNTERPDEVRELFIQQQQVFQNVLRQLIVEGQATGEVAAGDPEQLIIALTACLDGLSKYALRNPEKFKTLFPDANVVLRILRP